MQQASVIQVYPQFAQFTPRLGLPGLLSLEHGYSMPRGIVPICTSAKSAKTRIINAPVSQQWVFVE